jgi:hypothetical protein
MARCTSTQDRVCDFNPLTQKSSSSVLLIYRTEIHQPSILRGVHVGSGGYYPRIKHSTLTQGTAPKQKAFKSYWRETRSLYFWTVTGIDNWDADGITLVLLTVRIFFRTVLILSFLYGIKWALIPDDEKSGNSTTCGILNISHYNCM